MSAATILAIAIPIIVVVAALGVISAARRRDTSDATGSLSRETRKRDKGEPSLLPEPPREPSGREVEQAAADARRDGSTAVMLAEKAPVAPYVPPDAETVAVTRRQFFNRGIVTLMVFALSGFGAAVLAFLYPRRGGGFGSKITLGKLEDVQASIEQNDGFFYVPEGRAWVTAYPQDSYPKAEKSGVYLQPVLNGMKNGINALYQKCPHLGCRVPQCVTSQWFECPCHGSQYNQVGEKKGGPAPRGMDRFGVAVDNDIVTIDTSTVFQGPPIGTNTTGQEAEGPHCITGGE
jgi:cytochrome b6-f complex iron-sulfur subunit